MGLYYVILTGGVEMPRLIMIQVYDIQEACQELADRVGRTEPYSPKTIYYFIKQHIPELQKAGKHYFLTEADLDLLARARKPPGRPRINP